MSCLIETDKAWVQSKPVVTGKYLRQNDGEMWPEILYETTEIGEILLGRPSVVLLMNPELDIALHLNYVNPGALITLGVRRGAAISLEEIESKLSFNGRHETFPNRFRPGFTSNGLPPEYMVGLSHQLYSISGGLARASFHEDNARVFIHLIKD